ncbi:hypothetical protein AVDCRST_MAG94-2943 [uncultured Leptolyngbya sp.]|uniref:Uncharacterized protein n=1 Tax=uncultured Leptolyngbya sp. TaxID=332963 RepID=A0A6J4M9C5_9CYAN|nr:hypothetical protein AVDCRST_MAG94-2943 [uncultured Leptolyngbya sp.]
MPPVPEPQFQSEPVPELFSPSPEPEAQPENLIDVTLQASESHQALEELESSAQTELAPATGFKVDARIHVEGSQNKHVNGKTKNIARANSMHKTVAALVDGSLPWNTVSLPIQRCTKVDVQAEAPTSFQFEVGDRIHILRHQHGEGSWAGKTARIWQVTPDGHLRVDVEGHPEVRFSLHPDWVERIPEEIPEQHNEQLEQVLSPSWADEQDPEPPTVTDIPSLVQREGEAAPHVQPGDRVFLGDPNQQGQRWMGEVAEVLEAAEDCIKLIVELRPSGQTAVTTF